MPVGIAIFFALLILLGSSLIPLPVTLVGFVLLEVIHLLNVDLGFSEYFLVFGFVLLVPLAMLALNSILEKIALTNKHRTGLAILMVLAVGIFLVSDQRAEQEFSSLLEELSLGGGLSFPNLALSIFRKGLEVVVLSGFVISLIMALVEFPLAFVGESLMSTKFNEILNSFKLCFLLVLVYASWNSILDLIIEVL